MKDPVRILEAAYSPAADEATWVGRIAEAAGAVMNDGARGVIAVTYDATKSDFVAIRQLAAPGVDETFLGSLFQVPELGPPCSMVRLYREVPSASVHDRPPPGMGEFFGYFRDVVGRAGLGELQFVNATDPSHVGCMFVAAGPVRRRWSPRETHRWRLIAAHVAAGMRIHRKLAEPSASAPVLNPEAVLRPDGRIEHAEAAAQGALVRAALSRAALGLERARGPLRREDSDEALAVWEGLVEGRWSLVDHVDSDGRRFILAHRNDPDAPDIRGLTLRERQVVAYVALGHANKVIAYELGLTISTVASHLARARLKLGLRSLEALRGAVDGAAQVGI